MIEEYFCSKDFTNILKKANFFIEPLDDESRINVINYFIDISLKYYMLFSEKDKISFRKLNTFLETIIVNLPNIQINTYAIEYNYYLNKYVTDIYANTLIEKLNIPKNYILNKELTQKIYEYIIDKILGTSYIFHSFNSVFLESIKKYGINPNIMLTPQNELDEIYNLFKKHDYDSIIGFQKQNCEGQISYSTVPSSVYLYAIKSPEWFNYFTNSHIDIFSQALTDFDLLTKESFTNLDLLTKKVEQTCQIYLSTQTFTPNCHVTNNYEGAKQNIENLIKELDFTPKEEESTLSFLEKNWQIYANREPMVAIITKKITNKDVAKITANILENYNISSISDLINICFNALENDCQTKKIIDTSSATYIKLPSYNELIEKILQEKKENTKILKKSREELLCK